MEPKTEVKMLWFSLKERNRNEIDRMGTCTFSFADLLTELNEEICL